MKEHREIPEFCRNMSFVIVIVDDRVVVVEYRYSKSPRLNKTNESYMLTFSCVGQSHVSLWRFAFTTITTFIDSFIQSQSSIQHQQHKV